MLDEFAPQSLLPSLISGMALADLRTFLATNFWDDDPDALSQYISSGGPPNRTVIADAELHEVGVGICPLEQWIDHHGHRAAGEFDLAAVRWREQPEAAREMATRLAGGDQPLQRNRRHGEEVNARIRELSSRLPARDQEELRRLVDLVRRYVAFREDGKDFLMLGYDLLRDIALEAGRRLEIGEDVFYLTREDLFDSLRVGFAPLHLIQQRKSAYQAEAQLTLPRVIDEKTIDAVGEVPEVKTVGGYKAFAVSSGQAAGPARVRHSPTDAGDLGRGYILVCPSTDPSWTPLFVNAAGLVLECGGTLSHGAVVAREMGLPAVVLPDATRMFRDGEEIRVDGRSGSVTRAAEIADQAAATEIAADNHKRTQDANAVIPSLTPTDLHRPGAMTRCFGGPQEYKLIHPGSELVRGWLTRRRRRPIRTTHTFRTSCPLRRPYRIRIAPHARVLKYRRRDRMALRFICSPTFKLLPEQWLYQPSLTVLDFFLWPIVRWLGKPAVVAIIAAGIGAVLTLVLQKFITDNARLLAGSRYRRAALLSNRRA